MGNIFKIVGFAIDKIDENPIFSGLIFIVASFIFVSLFHLSCEGEEWEKSKELNSIQAYEKFIKQHKEGALADTARFIIKDFYDGLFSSLNEEESSQIVPYNFEGLLYALISEDSIKQQVARKSLINNKNVITVNSLISAFSDFDRGMRKGAIVAWCHIKDFDVDTLIFTLKNEDWRVREAAAKALGNTKDPKITYPLIESLKDEDHDVRKAVVEALGNIKEPKAVNPLIEALKDKDSDVREAVVKALCSIGDPKAVNPLIEALKDKDRDVREAAAEALGSINDPKVIDPLIAVLKNDHWRVRIKAEKALGKIKDPKVVDPLLEALKDKDDDVREGAAEALGLTNDPKVIGPLIEALKDEEYLVQKAAENALVLCKDLSFDNLIEILKSGDKYIRKEAAIILGLIKDTKAVISLIAALKDEDWGVRKAAAEALGAIKDPEAVYPLINALDDEDDDVKKAAAKSLNYIQDPKAINGLVEHLTVWIISNEISKALDSMNWIPQTDEERIHFLIAQKKDGELKRQWEVTKNVLRRDMESTNYNTIKNAIFAFVSLGNEEIIPVLIVELNLRGNKTMAECYLNCGNKKLRSAAEKWAHDHGYSIVSKYGGSHQWGEW